MMMMMITTTTMITKSPNANSKTMNRISNPIIHIRIHEAAETQATQEKKRNIIMCTQVSKRIVM